MFTRLACGSLDIDDSQGAEPRRGLRLIVEVASQLLDLHAAHLPLHQLAGAGGVEKTLAVLKSQCIHLRPDVLGHDGAEQRERIGIVDQSPAATGRFAADCPSKTTIRSQWVRPVSCRPAPSSGCLLARFAGPLDQHLHCRPING